MARAGWVNAHPAGFIVSSSIRATSLKKRRTPSAQTANPSQPVALDYLAVGEERVNFLIVRKSSQGLFRKFELPLDFDFKHTARSCDEFDLMVT